MSSRPPLAAALAAALAFAPADASAIDSPVRTDRSRTTGPRGHVRPRPRPRPQAPVAPAPPPAVPVAREADAPLSLPVPEDIPRPEGPAPGPTLARDLGCHGSAQCQRLVVLGAVSGGLGLATLAAGAALLLRPRALDQSDPTTTINYGPAGAAALAIGTGVLATGVLMLLAAAKAGRQAQRRGLRTLARGPGR